jgi:hypothetical protein
MRADHDLRGAGDSRRSMTSFPRSPSAASSRTGSGNAIITELETIQELIDKRTA